MEAGSCIVILDPYDWLAGHGENAVELRTQDGDLFVLIPNHTANGECKKELLFKKTCAFYKDAFPGPHFLDLSCGSEGSEGSDFMSSLVEYPDSEAAGIWTQHFDGLIKVKH
jgi:hypothetical protein